MSSGTIDGQGTDYSICLFDTASAKISGGTINSKTMGGIWSYGTLEMSGGTITANTYPVRVGEGKFNMFGGSLNGTGSNSCGIYVDSCNQINIRGESITITGQLHGIHADISSGELVIGYYTSSNSTYPMITGINGYGIYVSIRAYTPSGKNIARVYNKKPSGSGIQGTKWTEFYSNGYTGVHYVP